MSSACATRVRLAWILLGAAAGPFPGGCLAYHVVSAPVKLAATTVVVAGEAAGAVVTTTGRVAVSAVKAAGNVGSGGLDAAAQLAQAGMVTFADGATNSVVRVPWQEGLTLASAGDAAKLRVAQRSADVVRAGKVVYSSTRVSGEGAVLAPGDVVQLGK